MTRSVVRIYALLLAGLTVGAACLAALDAAASGTDYPILLGAACLLGGAASILCRVAAGVSRCPVCEDQSHPAGGPECPRCGRL